MRLTWKYIINLEKVKPVSFTFFNVDVSWIEQYNVLSCRFRL